MSPQEGDGSPTEGEGSLEEACHENDNRSAFYRVKQMIIGTGGAVPERGANARENERDKAVARNGSFKAPPVQGDKKVENSNDLSPVKIQRSTLDREALNAIEASPIPAVEKGGDNEFVRVSHLGSVQVKSVPTLPSILKNKHDRRDVAKRKSPTGESNSVSVPSHIPAKKSKTHKRDTLSDDGADNNDDDELLPTREFVKRKLPKRERDAVGVASRGNAKKSRSRKRDALSDEDLELSSNDESSVGNLIHDIEKSPYEPAGCAEDGEPIFEEMKTLLQEGDDDDNSKIAKMFGPTNAGCLVMAHELIDKSGMLYSQNWKRGTIRGNSVGIIPNHLLLMVLVSNRFVKASENLVSGLCRDLEVHASVNRGLDQWGWAKKYKLVRATKKTYKFKTQRRACYKCAVFVARAHSCFLAFGKRELEPRLIKKLKTCLDIMETHLIAPSSSGNSTFKIDTSAAATAAATATGASTADSKKKKKMIPDGMISYSPLVSASAGLSSASSTSSTAQTSNHNQDIIVKRKRGRPRKNSTPKHVLIRQQRHSSTLSSQFQESQLEKNIDTEEKDDSVSLKSRHRQLQSSKAKGGVNIENAARSLPRRISSPPVPSLHQLISRFEDQYKEMGKRYSEMGELLVQMKTAVEDNRERSEQEIRRELLDEIQRNILESMPKR